MEEDLEGFEAGKLLRLWVEECCLGSEVHQAEELVDRLRFSSW